MNICPHTSHITNDWLFPYFWAQIAIVVLLQTSSEIVASHFNHEKCLELT
jgi:hypothetical protein